MEDEDEWVRLGGEAHEASEPIAGRPRPPHARPAPSPQPQDLAALDALEAQALARRQQTRASHPAPPGWENRPPNQPPHGEAHQWRPEPLQQQ